LLSPPARLRSVAPLCAPVLVVGLPTAAPDAGAFPAPVPVCAAATPRLRADNPPGQWNRFLITMKGDRLTVELNGKTVIEHAQLPDVPPRGRIGLQNHGDPVQFGNIYVKESPRTR